MLSLEDTSTGYDVVPYVRKKERKEEWSSRHWSQKPLEEMTDRDWRIFREDFNIVVKGVNGRQFPSVSVTRCSGNNCLVPKPLRDWGEADMPRGIRKVIKEIGYKVIGPDIISFHAFHIHRFRSQLPSSE